MEYKISLYLVFLNDEAHPAKVEGSEGYLLDIMAPKQADVKLSNFYQQFLVEDISLFTIAAKPSQALVLTNEERGGPLTIFEGDKQLVSKTTVASNQFLTLAGAQLEHYYLIVFSDELKQQAVRLLNLDAGRTYGVFVDKIEIVGSQLPPPLSVSESVLPPALPSSVFCSDECQRNGSCEDCIPRTEAPAIAHSIDKACHTNSGACDEAGNDPTCAPNDAHLDHAYRRADIAWTAEEDKVPQEWSLMEPLLKLQYEWDKRVQNNTIRILTQNLHFRPYDLGSTVRTFFETIGASTNWGKRVNELIFGILTKASLAAGAAALGFLFAPGGVAVGRTILSAASGLAPIALSFLSKLASSDLPWYLKEVIMRELEFSVEDRAWINKKFPGLDSSGQLFNECVEIHSQNAQERRACEFVGALTMMEEHERPHILCIQEATHYAANRILYDKLEFIGYKGVKQSDLTVPLPLINPAGLTIFINQSSGIEIVSADSLVFGSVVVNAENPAQSVLDFLMSEKKTLGADNLGYKGCLAVELKIPKGIAGMDEDTYIIVATIHPSPYVQLKTGDTLYGLTNWFCAVEQYGEVVKIHKKQLDDTAAFLQRFRKDCWEKHLAQKVHLPQMQIYMTGDMNINRYAVAPDSDQEKNPVDASACCSVEYYDMLRRLNAEQPPVIPDVNRARWQTYRSKWEPTTDGQGKQIWRKVPTEEVTMPVGRGGLFTWDGEINAITKSPKWPESFSWIDYILYRKDGPRPLYMDNRAIRLTARKEFPEVSTYFQPSCVMFRNELVKKYGADIPRLVEETQKAKEHAERVENDTEKVPLIETEVAFDFHGYAYDDYKQDEITPGAQAPRNRQERKKLYLQQVQERIRKNVRRVRDLKKKICSLETVNNQQQCDNAKKCSILDLDQYENTYKTTVAGEEKTFTCDYKPRVTISAKSYANEPDLTYAPPRIAAAKATYLALAKKMEKLNKALQAYPTSMATSPGYDYNPTKNADGTWTIDREEYANPNFHAEERSHAKKFISTVSRYF